MLKEKYLTDDNIIQKTQFWLDILSPNTNTTTKKNTAHKRFKKFTLKNTALLIIDMQEYFLNEDSHAFVNSGKTIINNTNNLIKFFKKHNKTVIFTTFAVSNNEADPTKNWFKRSVKEGSKEANIAKEIDINKNINKINTNQQNINKKHISKINITLQDIIIRKSTYSSFYKTKLDQILKENNIKNLVIAGLLTNICVDMAVKEAFVRNLNIFIPIDATATYNEKVHINTLKNLTYAFATLITTNDIINIINTQDNN